MDTSIKEMFSKYFLSDLDRSSDLSLWQNWSCQQIKCFQLKQFSPPINLLSLSYKI